MSEEKFAIPKKFDLNNQFDLFLTKIRLDKRITDPRTLELLKLTFMAASQQMMTLLLHDLRQFPENEGEKVNKIIESLATQLNDFMMKKTEIKKKKPAKQGRNEACICGSGKKYKNCCYLLTINPIPNN